MEITFDPAKRQATLEARGLDFADAAKVFAGETIDFEDIRFVYPEPRWVAVGFLSGRMMIVVWTPVSVDCRRVISMRKANDREQALYGLQLRAAGQRSR
jgi:uncharacterized DUF497 family protein